MRPRPNLKFPGFLREILDTLVFVVAVFVLVEMATPRFLVEGRSMQPNFADGQRLIVSRLSYLFGDPERGDIIIFNAPGSDEDDPPLIKRVIGLPGDTITIENQIVYVNGVEINEPYIRESCDEYHCKDNTWVLGTDEYFMMGDNRNNSRDSRRFDQVKRENIIGEAVARYWPPDVWGLVVKIAFPDEP